MNTIIEYFKEFVTEVKDYIGEYGLTDYIISVIISAGIMITVALVVYYKGGNGNV